ncbi:MAG: response regulator [Nitrospirota bacterium]|nr:response regulator [Nitrospirota bacterium]
MSTAQILVVEDESIVAEYLSVSLQKMGYSVAAVVSSGEDAVRVAEAKRPDLILMDIVLRGDINGIEAAGRIHSACNIPVIYLTAYADEKMIGEAKLTEPFGYITKPFEYRELNSSIEMALYKHNVEKQLRESRAWLSAILGSINDAVVATDMNGHVLFTNSVADKMSGMEKEKAEGRGFEEVFTLLNENTGDKMKFPSDALFKETPVTGQAAYVLIQGSGTKITVDIRASRLKDADNAVKGVVMVMRDITECKKMEQELKEKVEHLRQYYEISIGRELEMKELKEEIQKLRAALYS